MPANLEDLLTEIGAAFGAVGGLRLGTMLRRELAGRRRYPGKAVVDAHMAVQVHDHRTESGPGLVERFALLWPRAVQARKRRPMALRALHHR